MMLSCWLVNRSMNLSCLLVLIRSRVFASSPSATRQCRLIADDAHEKVSDVNKTWKEKRDYERFGHNEWRPKKRLTRYQMNHLKDLHNGSPSEWTITKLSKRFQISHSAIKRILKSKFEPTEEIKNRQDNKAYKNKETRRKQLNNSTTINTND